MKRKMLTVLTMLGLVALFAAPAQAGPGAEPDFTAQAMESGLTATQAERLQERIDEVMSGLPGGTQVSATKVRYDGLDVVVDPRASTADATVLLDCEEGYFCIEVRGTRFNFYTCKTWTLSNWYGVSPWNNNQTSGTIARAYGSDGQLVVFESEAKESGSIDTRAWFYFRPC